MEQDILPHLLDFHVGNIRKIPVKSKNLLSRVHNDPEDEKVEALAKVSARQEDFRNLVSKQRCFGLKKPFCSLSVHIIWWDQYC